ncbi:MAG TPA: SBBP repeat-containing protein [Bacteroidia bacterium]|nr:SBBP repeat-containing protein [Bacteroidia bacterium]
MKTITTISRMIVCTFILFLSFSFSVRAQSTQVAVIREWVQHFANQDSIMESPSCKDKDGNFYVAGYTLDANTGPDIVVAKYTSDGGLVWSHQYSSSSNYGRDQATAICLDDSLNIYVCGFQMDSTTGTGFDIVTIKYNPSSGLIWSSVYSGNYYSGLDVPVAIGVNSGLVYVTGTTQDSTGLLDIVTLQYDANGTLQWSAQYDYVDLYDVPRALKTDDSKVYITGGSQNSLLDWDYLTLEYDASGNPVDTIRLTNTGNSFDRANAVALTDSGTVYITGRASSSTFGFNIRTVKIDSTGSLVWIRNFDLAGFDNEGTAMTVDTNENIYITGFGKTGTGDATSDYVTLKYDSAGNLIWSQTFNGSGSGKDVAWYVDVDSIGTVYVTGETWNGNNFDFGTIVYDSAGAVLWQDMYDGNAHGDDNATHIEHDRDGIVYVSGQSTLEDGTYEYITIQYDTKHFISPPDTVPCPSSFAFYGNFGQIIDTQDSVRMDVKYYTVHNYPDLYFFKPDADSSYRLMSYVFSRVDTDTATADTLHRVDMTFELHQEKVVPASENTKPFSVEKNSQGYLNYFLPQCPNGITGVEGFNKLLYPSVFDSTDILFYGNNAGMKFYIIMKPGSATDVGLNFDGQDSITVVGDTVLNIHTSIGTYSYPRPDVFQIDANGNRVDLNWQGEYVDWGNGRVGFYVGSIDGNLPFVIEMGQTPIAASTPTCIENLCWSTYIGTSKDDYIDDICTDDAGNVYSTGFSRSSNFPVHNGFQMQFYGSGNAIIMKHLPFGTPRWVTYYGRMAEWAFGITADHFGNVYVTGVTGVYTQPNPFPLIPLAGAYNHAPVTGHIDYAFLIKLDTAGIARWATLFGDDQTNTSCWGYAVVTDSIGNIYIGGKARKKSNFPIYATSSNYYQQSAQDTTMGFIAMFDHQTDTLKWSTLFGNRSTVIKDLYVDKFDRLYAVGFATDTNIAMFPMTSEMGLYQHAFNGGHTDGFVARFNPQHELKWSTFIGGEGEDGVEGVGFTPGYIYLSGYTSSADSFPIVPVSVPGALNDSVINGDDGFVMSILGDGGIDYCTYVGGSGNDYCYKLEINTDEYVFVTGKGNSTDFPLVHLGGAYRQDTLENDITGVHPDAFLMCIQPGYPLIWSTHFGGERYYNNSNQTIGSHEYAYGIATHSNSRLFLGGITYSDTLFPFAVDLANHPNAYIQTVNYGSPLVQGDSPVDCFLAQFELVMTVISVPEIENNANFGFNIFPNPGGGLFTITASNLEEKNVNLQVYDLLGRKIYDEKIKVNDNRIVKKLNLTSEASGIYLVRISTNDISMTGKIIKQ